MKAFIRNRGNLGAFALSVMVAGSAHAGIYVPSDPNPYPVTSSFSQIRLTVGEYRSLLAWDEKTTKTLPQPEKGSLQEQILTKMTLLETRLKEGTLTTSVDKLELTGCWLRTNQSGKVMSFLRTHQAIAGDPDSVFLLSHLAMAQANDPSLLPKAISTMEDFLEQWPEAKAGWKYPQWRWMRRAETSLLQLWKTRHRESLATGKSLPPIRIDPILGLEGLETTNQFQPGKLARNVWDKLDIEAEPLVVQLLFWLPNDARLYWAYGELLNARNEVGPAYQVMNELVGARQLSDVPQLFKHRATLSQMVARFDEKTESKTDQSENENNASPILGEFPMRLYLNAVGLGILVGAGVTILLILQWQFFKARFVRK